ncbi:unnamed protein product [Prorocentrum cordatum]|uniref:DNA-directed DNA polymerase n=1 Tax=Prorocentrum cordatum TaxID=2364126 RepID=A0ABN9S7N8_9DINO|nr:unnamed protein product [Polarella glacialis]
MQIISDAESTEKELDVSENAAQKRYAELVRDLTTSIEANRNAIEEKASQTASTEVEKSETEEAQLSNGEALEGLGQLLKSHHLECDFLLKSSGEGTDWAARGFQAVGPLTPYLLPPRFPDCSCVAACTVPTEIAGLSGRQLDRRGPEQLTFPGCPACPELRCSAPGLALGAFAAGAAIGALATAVAGLVLRLRQPLAALAAPPALLDDELLLALSAGGSDRLLRRRERLQLHLRVLLVPAGAGKWICVTPDHSVQFGDLTAHRVVPLPRNAPFSRRLAGQLHAFDPFQEGELEAIREQAMALAAVLGIEVPRGAAAAPPRLAVADPAHLQFGQVLDAAISGAEDRFVRRGAVALATLDADDDEGSFTVCENVPEERHQWLDEKHSEPGRDPRARPVRRAGPGGPRRATLDQAIESHRPQTADVWLFRGPKSMPEFLTSARASGLGIAGYANHITSSGVPPGSAAAHQIRPLLGALRHFIEHDQIDVANLAGAELIAAGDQQRAIGGPPIRSPTCDAGLGAEGHRGHIFSGLDAPAAARAPRALRPGRARQTRTLTPSQESALDRAARSPARHDPPPPDTLPREAFQELFKSSNIYSEEGRLTVRPFARDKAPLLQDSKQPREAVDLAPDHVRQVLMGPERFLERHSDELSDEPHIEPYSDPLLNPEPGEVTAGLFFVEKKGDRLRAIADGRQPNQFHGLPPQTSTASVEALAPAQVGADWRQRFSASSDDAALHEATVDLKDGLHQFKIPHLSGRFAFDAPGARAVDLGAGGALGARHGGGPQHVDNANITGVARDLAQARLERTTAALDLPGPKRHERQDAGVEVEIPGAIVDCVQGLVRPKPKRLQRLYGGLTIPLKWRKAAGWQIRAVLGHLVSSFQLLRSGPSVFRALCDFAQQDTGGIRELPTAALHELRVARSLLFLASGRRGPPPCPAAFTTGAWRDASRMHDCEARCGLMGSARAASHPPHRDAEPPSAGNNPGSALAFEKGRAANREIRAQCRRAAALQLASGIARRQRHVEGVRNAAGYMSGAADQGLLRPGQVWRGPRGDCGVGGSGVCGCDPKSYSHGFHGYSSTLHEPSDPHGPLEASELHQVKWVSGLGGADASSWRSSRAMGYLTGATLETGLRAGAPMDLEKGPHLDITDPKAQKVLIGWIRSGAVWLMHLATPPTRRSIARPSGFAELAGGMAAARFTVRLIQECQRAGAHFALALASLDLETPGESAQKPTKILAPHPLFALLGRERRRQRHCEALQGKLCAKGHWEWKTSLAAANPPSLRRAYAGVAQPMAPPALAALARLPAALGLGRAARRAGAVPREQAPGFQRRPTARQATAARHSDCVEELNGYIPRSGSSPTDPGAADSTLERRFEALFLGGEAKANAHRCLYGLAWQRGRATEGGAFPKAKQALRGWDRLGPPGSRGPAVWEEVLAVADDLMGRDLQSTLAGALPPRPWAATAAPATQPAPSKTNTFDDTVFLGSAAKGQGFVGNIFDVSLARAGQGPLFGGLTLVAAAPTPRCLRHGGAGRDALEKFEDLRGIQRRGR